VSSPAEQEAGVRVVYGVLPAVAVAPFLVILWYALGILAFALALGAGPWAEIAFWGGTAGLVLLDVWIGYLAYRAGD
jgi:phosphoglycerol transferase MdoB-like AlkP superfamily enzyme